MERSTLTSTRPAISITWKATRPNIAGWFPYNLRSLFDMMGGNEKVVARLDQFFTQLNAAPNRPYSWMGNEPGLAIPWAYDFADAPWRTQDVVRRVETDLFTPKPEGLAGNYDLGTMSAWYVFAAMGLILQFLALEASVSIALSLPG